MRVQSLSYNLITKSNSCGFYVSNFFLNLREMSSDRSVFFTRFLSVIFSKTIKKDESLLSATLLVLCICIGPAYRKIRDIKTKKVFASTLGVVFLVVTADFQSIHILGSFFICSTIIKIFKRWVVFSLVLLQTWNIRKFFLQEQSSRLLLVHDGLLAFFPKHACLWTAYAFFSDGLVSHGIHVKDCWVGLWAQFCYLKKDERQGPRFNKSRKGIARHLNHQHVSLLLQLCWVVDWWEFLNFKESVL